MDQPAPDWLTNELFEECLRKEKGNSNIIVTNFTVSSVAPPGNNYGSFIVRAKVEFKNGTQDTEIHTLSLIVKAEATHGPIKDLAKEMQKSEPSFYYEFIPAAKKFSDVTFVPESLFSPRANVTILENLKEQGFLMADRTKQLDFDHCRLYVMAAASFHAVSVAVYKEHPELLEKIKEVNFYRDDSAMKPSFEAILKCGLKCLAEATEKVESFSKYSELIRDSAPQMWDLVVEANKPSKYINTIRQGDPWTTNMMFKYDKQGKVCTIKMIDFQGTSYGSPINDLIFFIWSSANNDVKKHRLQELYRVYVDTLNEKLGQFNCTERLTFEQLQEEVMKLTPMTLCGVINLPNLFDPEPMDLTAIFSKEVDEDQVVNFFRKNYSDNYCSNYLPNLLLSMELSGVFNYLESKVK